MNDNDRARIQEAAGKLPFDQILQLNYQSRIAKALERIADALEKRPQPNSVAVDGRAGRRDR